MEKDKKDINKCASERNSDNHIYHSSRDLKVSRVKANLRVALPIEQFPKQKYLMRLFLKNESGSDQFHINILTRFWAFYQLCFGELNLLNIILMLLGTSSSKVRNNTLFYEYMSKFILVDTVQSTKSHQRKYKLRDDAFPCKLTRGFPKRAQTRCLKTLSYPQISKEKSSAFNVLENPRNTKYSLSKLSKKATCIFANAMKK
uniref:Uncharacterized protein n=1 Tax=Glossina palpalis gambiensis TaxID=67801 RepID=A0A1B0BXE8_9MUSC